MNEITTYVDGDDFAAALQSEQARAFVSSGVELVHRLRAEGRDHSGSGRAGTDRLPRSIPDRPDDPAEN